MDVSIVIVNFNTCRILDECIISIIKETMCKYEIIVVDNASTDGSCLMLHEKYPEVRLLKNIQNVGFARANNQGFAEATGKYFLMLNPDTGILDRAIDKLKDFMDGNPNVGICGPRNVDKTGNLQYSCDHFPSFWNVLWGYLNFSNLFPRIKMFKHTLMRYWDYSELRDVDIVMGCCLMVSSALYRRLNGLDNSYFMYFEESDLCYRVKKNGFRVVYVPNCMIIHHGGESAKTYLGEKFLDNKISKFYYNSQYYFMRKNYGMIPMLALRALDFSYGLILLGRNALRGDRQKREQGLTKGKMLCSVSLFS